MAQLVYFDSSVWIASLNNKDKHHDFANMLIEKMERGEIQVVLTRLAMMETIGGIRNKIPVFEQHTGILDESKKDEITTKILLKIKKFIASATEWERQEKILIADGLMSFSDFMKTAFIHHYAYMGKIVEKEWCSSCRRPLNQKTYAHYGLGHWDFQHALLARLLNVSILYSTDEDFLSLNSNPEFKSIQFITKKSMQY